jgi:hypothetical protein
MSDYIKSNIGSGYNSATNINTELGKIETAIASKVDEEGGVMTGDLQMNSNDVLNAGQISTNTLILDGVALTANNPVNSDTTVSTTRIVATAGQTVFTVPSYSLGINAIQVFLNGVKLSVATDYAETNTTTITLTNGASEDDVFEALIGATVTDANNYDSALVTYNQGGTGSVATNVKAKLQETVSVKDFGADSTGATDCSTAVQNALDTGEDVLFPAGTYDFQNVSVYSNQTIYISAGATLRLRAGTATAGSLFLISNVSDVRFTGGGTVDGNYANMAGQNPQLFRIQATSTNTCERITIDHLHIIDPPDRAIGLKTFASTSKIYDVNVHDCTADFGSNGENFIGCDNLGGTVYTTYGEIKRIFVRNNSVLNCITGFRFWACHDWEVTGNYVYCTSTTANECVGFFGEFKNVVINDNIFKTATSDPFAITIGCGDRDNLTAYVCDNVMISNNLLLGSGTIDTFSNEGIEIVVWENASAKNWSIEGNLIKGTVYGISLGGAGFTGAGSNTLCEGFSIRGNTIETDTRGIVFSTSGTNHNHTWRDIVIDGNSVTLTEPSITTANRGFEIRDRSTGTGSELIDNVTVSNNIARNAGYGFYLSLEEGGDNLVVTSNQSHDCIYGARYQGYTSERRFVASNNLYENSSTQDILFANFSSEDGCSSQNDRTTNGFHYQYETFAASDATPSVKNCERFETDTGTLTIASFDDGVQGQHITILCNGAVTFETTGAGNIKGSTADIVTAVNDTVSFIYDGTNWRLTSFCDVSVDNSAGA